MCWHNALRCSLALVVSMMVILFVISPIHAGDIWDHDYTLDKQQAFNCSMVQMSDEDLSGVTAAGFSSFTLENGVARAYFNIEASTFTEIDSLKMGYYSDDPLVNPRGLPLGWDQDWQGVSLGSSTEDLYCKGLFIEASFSNISDPASRTLDSLKIGTPSMTGPISANFVSFSGHIENPTDGVLVDGMRLNLGQRTIYSTNSEFSIQLSRTGEHAGWWFYWNNATVN